MDNDYNGGHVLLRQQVGAESPVDGYMLSVVMDSSGRAQAQLRDLKGKVVGVTPTIGPSGKGGDEVC